MHHGGFHHAVDAALVADVDAEGEGAEAVICGEGFACGGGIFGALLVEIGEDDAGGACFCKGEGGFAADACCCLLGNMVYQRGGAGLVVLMALSLELWR